MHSYCRPRIYNVWVSAVCDFSPAQLSILVTGNEQPDSHIPPGVNFSQAGAVTEE